MKAGLTSDMHIHRIYFCSQAGRKGSSETGYCIIFPAQKHNHTRARTRCVCGQSESSKKDGEVDGNGR